MSYQEASPRGATLPKVRVPVRLKIALPYMLLALVLAIAAAYVVSQVVLDTIEERFTNQLIEAGKFERLAEDYQNIYESNKELERTVVRRYRRDQYQEWTKAAGFKITLEVPSTYVDAVMLIHAQKQ